MEREGRYLEYKLQPTKSYLKTVSAFANYGTGRIIFGVSDDRQIVGIEDPEQAALNIENQINDNILPNPDYTITINSKNLIVLTVSKGKNTPYCYIGKAYKRNDSSTIAVSDYEYKTLILQASNLTFTEIPCQNSDLTFNIFARQFKKRFGIDPAFPDIYITLEIYDRSTGFTNAAALLADQNPFPGIDLVEYGESRSQILKRITLEKMSVLEMLEEAEKRFRDKYTYETVEGFTRVVKEMIPFRCFRELIANSLIHREWQLSSRIKVEMYPDHLYVLSPGGLPDGLTREEYLSDRHLSILRNRSLSLIFLKLGYVESLGSGISMIKETYASSPAKPVFQVGENVITTLLPRIDSIGNLPVEEQKILNLLGSFRSMSSSELLENTGMSRSTQIRVLNSLLKKNIIVRTGKGRAVKYSLPQQPQ